jgi:glycosyltransferase involved in cell wall biosynthesis
MAFRPLKVLDIELHQPLEDIQGLDGYEGVQALVRLCGMPIGYVKIPLTGGCCPAATVSRAIMERHSMVIVSQALRNGLTSAKGDGLCLANLISASRRDDHRPLPLVTVAVCTRDRTAQLAGCLDALCRIDYPALDLVVVDNAPRDTTTAALVHERYPQVRYVCEPRPGLNWARNRAIAEARGEIIAYTDDDVVVDRGWVRALAGVFAEEAEVMAVTGLVVPYELETEAQLLFEQYGGFGRGFDRKWYRLNCDRRAREAFHLRTGQFGTGANMAYRRSLFERIGGFDPALDVGTVTNGGGDLEMFFRVLQEGHTLVYEPSALVRHRHRRDYAQLRMQITDFGVGFHAYLVRSAIAYPHQRFAIACFGLWWLWRRSIRRLLLSSIHPSPVARDLILAELRGSLIGLGRYHKARRTAAVIAQTFGPIAPVASLDASCERVVSTKTSAPFDGTQTR